jgi:hypothetical protein
MQDMSKNQVYVVAFILALMGIGLFLYKALILDFPVVPGKKIDIWNIEAHITFKAIDKPVKISLFIPRISRNFAIINENFVSRAYGINTSIQEGKRKAVWSIRKAKGEQNLYYSASVRKMERKELAAIAPPPPKPERPVFTGAKLEAAESIVSEVREKSADLDTMVSVLLNRIANIRPDDTVSLLIGEKAPIEKRIELAVQLLALDGAPSRPAHGIRLEDQKKEAPILHWIEVYINGDWISYDPATGERGVHADYFEWWRGMDPLLETTGVEKPKVNISVSRSQEAAIISAIEMGKIKQPLLHSFSPFGLPLHIQSVYRVLLLVPVGAFLLVILRNVVGIKTFGTFMPVLIALAFRETQLIWGIFLFSIIIAMGLGIRLYLDHLKLLVVPRLASVLIVVIIMMLAFSVLTHKIGIERGLSVALFPMVILTMTIERMSIVWEELGPNEALKQGLGTLLTAAFAYLIITIEYVEHIVFVFPDLLLVLLAGTLLLGRYSGYRLMELKRFKKLVKTATDV